VSDFDRLELLAERRADLLDAATGMLQGVIRLGRYFNDREQSAWDYATAKADELGGQIDVLMADLATRGYRFPRPVH